MGDTSGSKRGKGRVLRFAVSGALLLGPAMGCTDNEPEYEETINVPYEPEPPTVNVPAEPHPVPNPTAPDPTTMQEPVPNPTAPDPAEPAPE